MLFQKHQPPRGVSLVGYIDRARRASLQLFRPENRQSTDFAIRTTLYTEPSKDPGE